MKITKSITSFQVDGEAYSGEMFLNLSLYSDVIPSGTATIRLLQDSENLLYATYTSNDLKTKNGNYYPVSVPVFKSGQPSGSISYFEIEYAYPSGISYNNFYFDNLFLSDTREVYQYTVTHKNTEAQEEQWNLTRRTFNATFEKKYSEANEPYSYGISGVHSGVGALTSQVNSTHQKHFVDTITYTVTTNSGLYSIQTALNTNTLTTYASGTYFSSGDIISISDNQVTLNGALYFNRSGFIPNYVEDSGSIYTYLTQTQPSGSSPSQLSGNTILSISQIGFSGKALGQTFTNPVLSSGVSGGLSSVTLYPGGLTWESPIYSSSDVFYCYVHEYSGTSSGALVTNGTSSGIFYKDFLRGNKTTFIFTDYPWMSGNTKYAFFVGASPGGTGDPATVVYSGNIYRYTPGSIYPNGGYINPNNTNDTSFNYDLMFSTTYLSVSGASNPSPVIYNITTKPIK